MFFTSLQQLESGVVLVEETYNNEVTALGRSNTDSAPVCLRVHDPKFYKDVVLRGSVGAGEAWMDGSWDSQDLEGLIRLMLRDREVLDSLETGFARIAGWALRVFGRLRANTRAGSRRNIAAHYDLGNDFFASFLDSSMTYSCGIFDGEGDTLDEAQRNKLDRLCTKLDLTADDHLLEIGTGWGSFAIHAARDYGCRVTTTTISQAQHELASKRVADAGLADRVTVLLEDYRDLSGQFDKLASIEMVEAVGDKYLQDWFTACSRLLKPDGCMAFQAITIQDQHYKQALRDVDFIKRYIFPGSFIPSSTRLLEASTAGSDLRLLHMEDFGPHYAETLRRWQHTLNTRSALHREMGLPDEFLRMWNYYLSYCAAGFEERFLGVAQFLLRKPKAPTQPLLGELQHHPVHPAAS